MAETVARARAITIARHPLYSLLMPVPIVCFVGVLLTDIAYLNSGGNLIWLDFSSWLLLAGLVFGAIAALILLIDFGRSPAMRVGAGWAHMLFFYAALLVGLLSMFVHSRDGWTAVAGMGLVLSIIAAVLILIAGWLHRPAIVEVAR